LRVALVSSVAGFALLALSPGALAAAGELDPTFDGDGRVTRDLGASDESAVDVAVQPDGKIVMLGTTGMSAVLARYTSTGALDTTFDGDGFLVFTSLHPSALALQPDGKIVVAGTANADFALARFKDDGTPDDSFDGDGLRAPTSSITPTTSAAESPCSPTGRSSSAARAMQTTSSAQLRSLASRAMARLTILFTTMGSEGGVA
jgi:uncharacterized delta-60 repeat protein